MGRQASDVSLLPKCTVCGMDEARNYYGGLVCKNCRVFFYRVVMSRKTLICRKTGNCRILLGNHANTCSPCRFRKCLENNMDKSIVGRVRRITWKTVAGMRQKIANGNDVQEVQIEGQEEVPSTSSSPSSSVSLPVSNSARRSVESPQEADVSLSPASNPECESAIGESPFDWVPLLIELEMAVNEQDICATIKPSPPSTPISLFSNHKKDYYIWMAHQYLRYLSFCPEIKELPQEDQTLLICRNYELFGTFSQEYYTWLSKQLPNSSNAMLTAVQVQMAVSNLKEIEFIVLKIMCLISAVESLSPNGQALILLARQRFLSLLSEVSKQPNLSKKEEEEERIRRLLAIPNRCWEITASIIQPSPNFAL